MAQDTSIAQQLLEATQIRLVWANKEKTRVQVILWAYKGKKNNILNQAFELYMKAMPRERIMTYYRHEDAEAFWFMFFGAYSIYEEAHPDMAWAEYLQNIDVN
ncbi:MAG: hypothetical protein EBR82_57180 [Caulobacteraceae bacterium]|nr:hypothetical protein [Caulobacteraceae bacterium]